MKKNGIFIRLSNIDKNMIKFLREKRFINVSALFRDVIKNEFDKAKKDLCSGEQKEKA